MRVVGQVGSHTGDRKAVRLPPAKGGGGGEGQDEEEKAQEAFHEAILQLLPIGGKSGFSSMT